MPTSVSSWTGAAYEDLDSADEPATQQDEDETRPAGLSRRAPLVVPSTGIGARARSLWHLPPGASSRRRKEEEEEEEEEKKKLLSPLLHAPLVACGYDAVGKGSALALRCLVLMLVHSPCSSFAFLVSWLRCCSRSVPFVVSRPEMLRIMAGTGPEGQLCSWLVLLVMHLALCSFLSSSGLRCLSSWPVWTRRSSLWRCAENCGNSAVTVHHGRRHTCHYAEADPCGPCDQEIPPVAGHSDRHPCCAVSCAVVQTCRKLWFPQLQFLSRRLHARCCARQVLLVLQLPFIAGRRLPVFTQRLIPTVLFVQ